MSEHPNPVTDPEPTPDLAREGEVVVDVAGASPEAVTATETDADATSTRGPADEPTLEQPEAAPTADQAGVATTEPAQASHTELAEVEEDPRTREELLVAAHEAERQRDEYLDDLRRARAEFENFRRRTGREAAASRDAGRGDVASALLDVLDDLDRTLEAADGSSDETLAKGVSLVADKLTTTLRNLGLTRLEPTGDVFDPALHEAVQQVAADEPVDAPVVESTLRPGYRLGDRVLRPAMVVVRG